MFSKRRYSRRARSARSTTAGATAPAWSTHGGRLYLYYTGWTLGVSAVSIYTRAGRSATTAASFHPSASGTDARRSPSSRILTPSPRVSSWTAPGDVDTSPGSGGSG